ncbi:hypothetical protein SLA2020_143400 [Shorea laevis]
MQFWLKVMVVMLVVSVLVAGKEEETVVVGEDSRSGDPNEKQNHKQPRSQRASDSFGVFFSSKRKVPNASDPLHNR